MRLPKLRSAKLASQALDRVGEDGVINIEDDRRYGIQLDFVDGMSFPSGLLAHGLATDETKRQSVFEQPLILTASERITQIRQLAPVLTKVAALRRPLVIIADEVSGDALTMLVLNVRKRTIPAVAVKAPLFGEDRLAMLHDIAAVTGGSVVGQAMGRSVDRAELTHLGSADQVTVTPDRTTIILGDGDQGEIAERFWRGSLRSCGSSTPSTSVINVAYAAPT